LSSELTFENYPEWYRIQIPEVQKDLRDHELDPDSVEKELRRLTEKGNKTDDFKKKIVYLAFYYSSDESTQKRLVDSGCVSPMYDHGIVKSNRGEKDFAESDQARTESLEYADSEEDWLIERYDLDRESAIGLQAYIELRVAEKVQSQVSHNLQQVVAVFLSAPNAKIAAGGLAFAAGLSALNGLRSQTQYAARIRVSKASISKSTRYWKQLLDLPANSHMKTDDACDSYSKAQKEKHWRNKKYGSGEERNGEE